MPDRLPDNATPARPAEGAPGAAAGRRDLYRSVFDAAGMGMAVLAADGTVTAANPALSALVGRKGADILDRPFTALLLPPERSRQAEVIARMITGETAPHPFEVRFLLPEGGVRHAAATPSRIEEPGRADALLLLVEDVSERRGVEQVLRRNERRYRDVIEATSEGFWHLDRSFRTVEANDALCRILACPRAEIQGQPIFDFIDPAHRDEVKARFARRFDGRYHTYDVVIRARDGREVIARMHTATLYDDDGEATGYFALVSDLTALKRREEALALSEARYRAIVETAAEAVLTADLRGFIMSANPTAERMTGWPADELVGRHISVLMAEEDAREHGQYVRRYLETGQRRVIGFGREVRLQRKDGGFLPVWLSLSEINMPGFHVFVAMIRDITETKRAEQALIEARDAAELANRAKTAFLSNMSHELRTPLNGILGFAEVIHQQMLGALENPMYVNYVAEIKRSGELLLANINDLLEMATIEAGQSDLEVTLIDFRDVVVTCLRLVAKRAEQAGVKIQPDVETELPPLMADGRALKQVLLHLLSNAIKFTPPGGTIGVSARVDSNGNLVAEVFDTGIGIPEDRLETVFQPFTQCDASHARRYEGIGLGLSIAKSLIEQHGGHIAIRSTEGVGTALLLTLPKDRFVTDW